MGRLSHLKRNTGWGGVVRVGVVLAAVTVVPTVMWAMTGVWIVLLIVVVSLALPVLARNVLVRYIERTGLVLRVSGYALMACAFASPFLGDSVGETADVALAAGVFSALSLYISAFATVASDFRVEMSDQVWR